MQQVALKSESLDVKTRLASEELTALTLGNSLASQKEQLNLLLGRDVRTPMQLEPMAEASLYESNLETAQAHALEQRPEVREARLKVEQAGYDRRVTKAGYIQDVSLAFNYFSPFGVSLIPQNVSSLGISISWDVFDWGRRKHQLVQKSRAAEQAELALRETESQVLVQVSSLLRKLEESRMQMQVARLGQQSAQERLRVTTDRYAQRAVLFKDVLQAQNSLAQANQQVQQALAAFWTARADFQKALGEE
jgi:outer membrane protein TolC